MARRMPKDNVDRLFDPMNPKFKANRDYKQYFNHYYMYLRSLAYQLFQWEGLPDSVDPRYLEMSLHDQGYVAFYKDPNLSYLALQGALSGRIDNYGLPTAFHASAINYYKTFPLYNYKDIKKNNMGVVIYNNDLHVNSLGSITMFAQDLAELKSIIRINQNAQKTPIALKANKNTRLSLETIFSQVDGNSPVIITDEAFDTDNMKAINLSAPVVFPQLNDQKNNVWNEFMTWLGVDNTNLMKKERMVTAEVEGNKDQVDNSANIFLKSRQEASEKINDLYGLNTSVHIRAEIVQEMKNNINSNTNVQSILQSLGGGFNG